MEDLNHPSLLSSHRSLLRTMRLVLLVCQLGLVFRTRAQVPDACISSNTNRAPGQCYLQSPLFAPPLSCLIPSDFLQKTVTSA